MPDAHQAELAGVLVVMALPLVMAVVPSLLRTFSPASRAGVPSADAFRTNHGRNGFVPTLAGAVAGNVGIGSFLAIFLLAGESAIIGASIVAAYTLGLVGCAVLAPRIRARCRMWGVVGLVDVLVASGGSRSARLAVWLPVAFVFVLRSAVQVGALGVIASGAFGIETDRAIWLSAALLGGYLIVGGYRAAVSTDIAQAAVLLVGVGLAATGLAGLPPSDAAVLTLGPHSPALVVGIWLFLPWSAVLAVDNWQRIALARSDRVAVGAYLVAAPLCAGVFATIALAGAWAPDGAAMQQTLATLMPAGLAWIVPAVLVACIMSSVDTFVMPLAASLGPRAGVGRMRAAIALLLGATALSAVALGDMVATVITAFNGLAVFVPAALGALFGPQRPPLAAPMSLTAGLLGAMAYMTVDPDAAALVGAVLALVAYLACLRLPDGAPPHRASPS